MGVQIIPKTKLSDGGIMKLKLFIILILSSFLFCGCQDAIWIIMENKTQDNLEINRVGGPHVDQGESYHVMTLYRDLPQGSFKICRGYGCLANVTVKVEFWLQDTQPKVGESTIIITENPRDTFQVTGGGYITEVNITPLDY